MTDWNLETDEVDEFDPSNPLLGEADPTTAPVVPDVPPAADDDGFSDESHSVTVWVDDAQRLTQVRVSNRWRERSKEPLADRVQEALRRAQPPMITPPAPLMLPRAATRAWANPLDMPLDETVEALRQLRERRRALDGQDVEPPRWTGHVGEGRTLDQKVSVVLNRDGATDTIEIDEAWAAQARAEQIAEAIMTAHFEAYNNHDEGSYELNDYGRVAQECARLADELRAPDATSVR